MKKYEKVLKLAELRKQLDLLIDRHAKDPKNLAVKEEAISLSREVYTLEVDILSHDQQLEEGWDNDQD